MKVLKFIIIPLSLLFLLGFVLFLVSQVANLVYLADRIDPLWGDIVLYTLCSIIFILLAVPLYTYFTLPKALFPPQNDNPKALEQYQLSLISRYRKNSFLRKLGIEIASMEDVHKAVPLLDQQADKIINYNTVRVFAGTAISQNGMFDSMIVFYFAINTIFRVSRVYLQRTSLRQLISLYNNIAFIVIGAKLLEDNLDQYLEENIEEFIEELASQGAETTASVGAKATRFIPGLGNVVESIVEGTFNGLMILRIGLITKKFCGATNAVNRKAIRRASFAEARKNIFKIISSPKKEFFNRMNIFSSIFKRKSPSVSSDAS